MGSAAAIIAAVAIAVVIGAFACFALACRKTSTPYPHENVGKDHR